MFRMFRVFFFVSERTLHESWADGRGTAGDLVRDALSEDTYFLDKCITLQSTFTSCGISVQRITFESRIFLTCLTGAYLYMVNGSTNGLRYGDNGM